MSDAARVSRTGVWHLLAPAALQGASFPTQCGRRFLPHSQRPSDELDVAEICSLCFHNAAGLLHPSRGRPGRRIDTTGPTL